MEGDRVLRAEKRGFIQVAGACPGRGDPPTGVNGIKRHISTTIAG